MSIQLNDLDPSTGRLVRKGSNAAGVSAQKTFVNLGLFSIATMVKNAKPRAKKEATSILVLLGW